MAIDPIIQKKANDIRTKVYGIEVREDLASGLETISSQVVDNSEKQRVLEGKQNNVESQFQQVIDETTGTDFDSAPEIKAARGTHLNLSERFASTDQQLTEIKELKNYELQNKTRKVEKLFIIVDDDGKQGVVDILEPIRQQYNIPMTTAIVTNWTNGAGYLSKEQIIDLSKNGWEVTSHSHGHEKLSTLSYEEQLASIRTSKEVLQSWGIDAPVMVYPYGARNDNTVEISRKYFRAGRSTDYGINQSPLETFDLKLINGEGNTNTVASMKADIDKIALEGGLAIYLTHATPTDGAIAPLKELIPYALSKGIEFVTFKEALNRMGNIVDSGRFYSKDLSKPHGAIGADGSIRSNTIQPIIKTKTDAITSTTPPSFFKIGLSYHTRILYANRTGFPESKNGSVYTELVNAESYDSYVRQTYTPYGSNTIYVRFAIDKDTWSPFYDGGYVTELKSNLPFDASPNDFPFGVTYEPIKYSERNGFPMNAAGTRITYRTSSYIWQDYHVQGKTDTFKRVQKSVSPYDWGAWSLIHSQAKTNGEIQAISVASLSPGDSIFSTTLNKPLYRNASNNGWVDSSGTTVL